MRVSAEMMAASDLLPTAAEGQEYGHLRDAEELVRVPRAGL